MAVVAQGGFGIAVKIGGAAIAKVLDAEFPAQTKKLVEALAHDSSTGYMEYVDSGVRELESFEIDLVWDSDEATHASIVTAFNGTATTAMSIEDPSGSDEVISFSAHIEQIGRIAEIDGLYHCKVKIQPSGAPTIT